MENREKLKLLRQIKKLVKRDWEICEEVECTYGCFKCYAGIVERFIETWINLVKAKKL